MGVERLELVADPAWNGMQRLDIRLSSLFGAGAVQLEMMRGGYISGSKVHTPALPSTVGVLGGRWEPVAQRRRRRPASARCSGGHFHIGASMMFAWCCVSTAGSMRSVPLASLPLTL